MFRPPEHDDLQAIAEGWGVPVATATWAIVAEQLARWRRQAPELGKHGLAIAAAVTVLRLSGDHRRSDPTPAVGEEGDWGVKTVPRPAPLVRILHAYGLRRVEVAAAAGVNLKTIDKLCTGDVAGMKIDTLCRVASALGVAARDLVPQLARPSRRPSSGAPQRASTSSATG